MAYTFFLAQGKDTGKSLVEPDKVGIAKDILAKAAAKGVAFMLPLDNLLTASIESGKVDKIQEDFPYPPDLMGVDIGPKTIALYEGVIASASFWLAKRQPAFSSGVSVM